MELVIKIPDEAYQRLLEEQHLPNRIDLEYFIVHGTPLPKGHGRLVDADAILEEPFGNTYRDINIALTIIEADKEQD